jgi:hypothetical protein
MAFPTLPVTVRSKVNAVCRGVFPLLCLKHVHLVLQGADVELSNLPLRTTGVCCTAEAEGEAETGSAGHGGVAAPAIHKPSP